MTLLGVDDYLIALKSPNAHERRNAAWNLGRFRDLPIADALITALTDADASVRVRAAESLGAFGLPHVVDALTACALEDADHGVRAQALMSLGRINQPTPAVINVLLASLHSEISEIRAAAAEIAGDLSTPESVAPLVAIFLHDADEIARYGAGRSLARIGSDAVIEALRAGLDGAPPEDRVRIADVLGLIKNPRVIPILTLLAQDDDPSTAEVAQWALKAIGKP